MGEFKMPSLGADMETGVLTEWFVEPGASVEKGQVIASVETMKGVIEIEVFESGVVREILVSPGTKVPVGTTLAIISSERVTSARRAAEATPVPEPPRTRAPSEPGSRASPSARRLASELHIDLSKVGGSGPHGAIGRRDVERRAKSPAPPRAIEDLAAGARARISPAARQRAAELGLDPNELQGTGPEGAVTLRDVESGPSRIVQSEAPVGATAGFDPDKMRQGIALAMAKSKREIPHYYLRDTIDLKPALAWLEADNAQRSMEARILPAAMFLKATARALTKHPELNGFYRDGQFVPGPGIHIGMAIALRGGGLIAPAIHDVDQKSLSELMTSMKDLVERSRTGKLRGSEMTDPTITVTSMGDRGVEEVFGVIYPPQVAILGFGKIVSRPWAVDDAVGVHPVVTVTLAGDHRAHDGHLGALFLSRIGKLLEKPEEL